MSDRSASVSPIREQFEPVRRRAPHHHVEKSRSQSALWEPLVLESKVPNASTPKAPLKPSTSKYPFTIKQALSAWWVQILCWSTSAILLMSMTILLWHFDQQLYAPSKHGLQLNSIIQVLAGFSDAFLLGAVCPVMGQIKWTRVQQARPLRDFLAIDLASRGAFGSMLLVLKRRGGFMSYLGASVILMALIAGFFVQQSLRIVTGYHAVIYKANRMAVPTLNLGNYPLFQTPILVESSMAAAAYGAVLDSSIGPVASCSAGNCTFPTLQTLAICNTCVDISEKVQSEVVITPVSYQTQRGFRTFNVSSLRYFLPNDFGLLGQYIAPADIGGSGHSRAVMNLTWTTIISRSAGYKTLAFGPKSQAITSMLVIGPSPLGLPAQPKDPWEEKGDLSMSLTSGIHNAPHTSYECLLEFCAQTINAEFVNGEYRETIVNTYRNHTEPADTIEDYYLTPPLLNETSPIETFVVPFSARLGLQELLQTYLGSRGSVRISTALNRTFQPESAPAGAVVVAMNGSRQGFPEVMDNVASKLTMALRSLPYQERIDIDVSTHYDVRWLYLLYLAAMSLMGLVLLLMAIQHTRVSGKLPWKDSLVATLFHAFDARAEQLGETQQLASKEKRARGYTVHLQKGSDGAEDAEYLLLTSSPTQTTKTEALWRRFSKT